MKTISKVAPAVFKISTPDVPNSELTLNFDRVIEEFKLSGNFYLIHWQARPKGFREWGIYSSLDDSYISTDKIPTSFGGWSTLQLNDATATTVPSAVIYFKGSIKK